ncbi:hypothetical protein F4679DRAFT_584336 [Xylaria curta]|nr:hypothetical protein F4679DRAFT_584336 [Xylaria curta]
MAAFEAYAKSNLPKLLEGDDGPLDLDNYASGSDAAYKQVLAGGTLTSESKLSDNETKLKIHIGNITSAVLAIRKNRDNQLLFLSTKKILLRFFNYFCKKSLDTSDQTIFTSLTQLIENEFTEDMDALLLEAWLVRFRRRQLATKTSRPNSYPESVHHSFIHSFILLLRDGALRPRCQDSEPRVSDGHLLCEGL